MYEIININGATFIFSPFKDLETASLGVFLKIGSRFEEQNVKGIAHFLEHLLFKGTKNYSHRKIKREIEGRGGSLNGFTSQEHTAYYIHFLNKNLEPTLDILLDMVFNPLLKKEDIEKERNVILEEIKMYNDLPSSRATALLDKLLWQNHPLGEEVIGDSSTVKRIKRLDLLDFINRYYLPSNMIISCSGNFDREKTIKLLEKRIKKSSYRTNIKSSTPSKLSGLHIKIERKRLEQSHLCLGFRSVSYLSKDRLAAQLINIILGANMSSRLFEEIREKKGLCYEISTEAKKYKDSGAFVIHLGLDKRNISQALKTILKELTKIKEKKVLSKELERAKDFFIGQIAMGLERPQGRMFYLAENYLALGKIYTLKEIKKKIANIDSYQLMKLTQKIFKFENMCISCVGDIEEKMQQRLKAIV